MRERMVELYLNISSVLSYRHPVLPEHPVACQLVQLPHEIAGIETQRIIAFLEFVQLLYYSGGDDDVIFLEMPYAFEVMENDIGVQHEYLGSFPAWTIVRHIRVSCHGMWF